MLIAQRKVQLHLHFKWPATFQWEKCWDHSSPAPSFQKRKRELRCLLILKQACSPEYQRAQYAFKDSMIHWILQFTLRIAFRCVLHRCESQEIRCWKLYFELSIHNMFQTKSLKFWVDINPKGDQTGFWQPAGLQWDDIAHKVDMDFFKSAIKTLWLWMILPQVHLRKPCYDFYFL